MSEEPRPITLSAFAEAIKELTLSAVYAKVLEIRNSIAHLRRSNAELTEFINESCESETDKRELEGYLAENEGVIVSMTERIGLLKAEIEGRGEPWIEEEVNETGGDRRAASSPSRPVVNGTTEDERDRPHRDAAEREDIQTSSGNEEEGVYL